jgi:hypothetical protein
MKCSSLREVVSKSDVIINSPCAPSEQTSFCCWWWWVHLWCVYFVWCALRSLVSLAARGNQFVSRGTRVHHNRDQGCILFLTHTETHSTHSHTFERRYIENLCSAQTTNLAWESVAGCVFTLGVMSDQMLEKARRRGLAPRDVLLTRCQFARRFVGLAFSYYKKNFVQ